AAPLPRVTCASVLPAGKPLRERLQKAVRPAAVHYAMIDGQGGIAARAHCDLLFVAFLEHHRALLQLAEAEDRRLGLRNDDRRGEQAAAHAVIGKREGAAANV